MKYLLVLLICIGCQKHIMPKEKDLYDIDADGIQNEYDSNPNLVDVPDFEALSGKISFYTNNKSLYHQFDIDSDVDFENYLYKNLFKKSLQHDFLSEETLLNIDFENETPKLQINDEIHTLVLLFQPNQTPPKNIYISYNDKDYFLTPWSENIEVNIPGPTLKDLITKKARLKLEYAELDHKKIKDITKVNKRVIYKSNNSIEVMYVTHQTTLPQVLSMLHLRGAKDLNQVNLFQTQINNDYYTWAKEKDNTIFIIDGSLKEIYEGFLTNFDRFEFEISRTNGKLEKTIQFKKNPNAVVIFKYSGKRSTLEFKEYKKENRVGGGGKEGNHDLCKSYYREVSKTSEFGITSNEIENLISLSTNYDKIYSDHQEIVFSDNQDQLLITNNHLPQLSFVTLGRYASGCKETSDFKQANEGYLKVKVEAYIEKN